MKKEKTALLIFIILFFPNISHSQDILTIPFGAKSLAMAGTGYTIANDGTALLFNPALLGISNSRWNGGEAYYYREPMIFDIVKSNYSIVLQHKNIDKFGFSAVLNLINFETDTYILNGDSARYFDRWYSYELDLSSGIGYCIYSNSIFSISIGTGTKYYRYSAGSIKDGEEYYGNAFSFDFGYLLQFVDRIRFGIVISNVGPNSKWKDKNDSTFSKYVQPTTLATGIGYIDNFDYGKLKVLSIATELSLRRTIVESSLGDVEELLAGIELNFFNTVPIRAGLKKNIWNKEKGIDLVSFGTGVSLFNHFNFDIFWSFYTGKYGRDDPNYGFSISMTRILNWNKNDKKWWLENWNKAQME